ncbi:hypothetical protein GFS24_10935 [Chitinophaga sp. SYP-B3965]|uniref:DUF4397 domain-containing protein n=1 Tax=Chitinophaga sp. SYP-B3965 TaxID=2663120 RepID=UPI001299BC5E|nr:DUF4397 domain-containing protein [Chitinophaga sp. SYP-B3965]MRG45634.1 hypothetical protein [Chitinophaga sp. SYP-B3965]
MVTMKNRFVALLAMVAVITGLSSCLKNNVTPDAPSTVIYFINGSPAFGMDLIFNSKKANSAPFTFGASAGDQFAPANIKIDFTKTGTDSLLTSVTANFDTLQYNTIFLYGNSMVKSYRVREDFSTISREKANVRFMNFVESATPVDFYINANKVSSGRYFEDFLGDVSLQAQDAATVTVTVKDQAGTELATLPNVNLLASNAYTIAYMGIPGQTGDKKPVINVYRQ